GRAACEGPQMQEGRHARPVIHGVVVPKKGLALQCLADAGDMRGVNFPGTDKRAGPENLDGGIKFLPQRVEIAFRALAEKAVEYGVIRVIARADDQTPCFRALCNT